MSLSTYCPSLWVEPSYDPEPMQRFFSPNSSVFAESGSAESPWTSIGPLNLEEEGWGPVGSAGPRGTRRSCRAWGRWWPPRSTGSPTCPAPGSPWRSLHDELKNKGNSSRGQVKQDPRGLGCCYYEPSERGNKKVISVVPILWTYSKLNSADGNLHSVVSPHTLGARCRDKSIKCSIFLQVCRWHLFLQSIVRCSSFRDRELPLVHKHACMQCVLFFAPAKMQFSGCRKHTNTMAFLGCTVWTSCDLWRNKDRKSPQGSRCTLDVLKCWGICHGQPG